LIKNIDIDDSNRIGKIMHVIDENGKVIGSVIDVGTQMLKQIDSGAYRRAVDYNDHQPFNLSYDIVKSIRDMIRENAYNTLVDSTNKCENCHIRLQLINNDRYRDNRQLIRRVK